MRPNPARAGALWRKLRRGWRRSVVLDRALQLSLCRFLRRNVRVAGRHRANVCRNGDIYLTNGPPDSAGEQILEESVLPVFRPITYCGIENAAFAVHAGPGTGVRAALIAGV